MALHEDLKVLRRFLNSLPQELYEIIFDYTFAWSPQVVRIDETYKPPSLLQVDHSTREIVRAQYLARSIFVGKASKVLKWLERLSEDERDQIQDVRSWIYGSHERVARSSMMMLRTRCQYSAALYRIDDRKESAFRNRVKFFGSERAVLQTVDIATGVHQFPVDWP